MQDNNHEYEQEYEYDHEYDAISADRLCEASEAVLLAMATLNADGLAHDLKPGEVLGSQYQPACLKEFTREEIVEAAAFLRRLGVLDDA